MVLTALFFYLFASVMVMSGLFVIIARNPVHAVLWLILAFFNAAGLFVLLGAEFLAMILVVVYVGAVAVLFLFVVMMLDVDFASLRAGFIRHASIGAAVGLVLLVELIMVVAFRVIDRASEVVSGASPAVAEEAAKTTTPIRNVRRRPKMSPRRPPVANSTAKERV